jgi:hypothetical protein
MAGKRREGGGLSGLGEKSAKAHSQGPSDLERERRGFASMMQYLRECGSSANWTLHSPTMPRCLATRMEDARSMW